MNKPNDGNRPRSSMGKPGWPCHPLNRVHYFRGQLLTADDFTAEQNYHLEKHRRHNRMCHGSGVVQGLQVSVTQESNGCMVIVSPGFAIDPLGNEIQLCADIRLRLREPSTPTYVVIRFKECPTDPVPAPGEPLPFPEAAEQYSRIQEECEVLLSPSLDPTAADPDLSLALPLARLVRRGDGWRADGKFKVSRAH
jgi:hypothetical protein